MELKRYKLGEIAEILISSIDKKSKEGESPVRLCNFVDVYHNWAVTADMVSNFMEATTSEKNIDRFSLKKGYVAFTKDSETRDDIGVPTYIAEDLDNTVLGYHCALVKPDENIISGKYLNAFLHSDYIKRYFELNATGSGMRYTLSVDTLYNIPILAPSLDIQKRIGDLFSNIDRKICINRSLNHYLEAMVKQLYDYWFVQFDFPDANGNPYKSSGGKMVWNEKLKREIPMGWTNIALRDYSEIYNGATPSTEISANYGGDIIWITPKDLSDQQSKFTYYGHRNITSIGYNSCSTRLLPANTILLSSRAPIGLISIAMVELCTNQGFKSLVCKDLQQYAYLYYYVKHHIKQIEQLGTGTTFKEVSREDLCSFPILKVQSIELMNKWFEQTEPILMKQYELTKEINLLSKQRDELLPLLMTGQVSVKQLNNDL